MTHRSQAGGCGQGGGGPRCPAPAQPGRFAHELLPPSCSLSLLLFTSLPFPSHLFPSLFFLLVLLCTTGLYWEQKWGKSGNTERSGRCFNLPKAMKRNQAAGVCKSRGSDLDIAPSFLQEKSKIWRKEDLVQSVSC